MGFIISLLLASIASTDGVVCSGELRALPEPGGWLAWPIVDSLGGYRIGGERGMCVGHGIQCATKDAELTSDGVCPREGLSLRSWFDENGIYASPSDIRLRASGGAFAVSALKGKEERYLGAFRPITGARHPAFKHVGGLFCSLLLTVGLAGMLAAGIDARRRIAKATAFGDPTRFKPASRDAANAIVFEDGSLPPIASGSEGNPSTGALPGPVLVRVAGVKEGSYRRSPSTSAVEVLEGDAAALAGAAVARGKSNLTIALEGAFFTLVIAVLVQACTALSDFHFD